MGRLINAVVCGIVIAVVLVFLLSADFSFIAYLLASIIVIYLFAIMEVERGILVAFAIYVFTEWIFGSIALVGLFALNETITYSVDEWMIISQFITTLLVFLGGIVGPELAKTKRQRAMTFQPSPIPVPPPSTLPVPPPVPVAASSERKFCRYCGVENKSDAVFCEKCGKRIE